MPFFATTTPTTLRLLHGKIRPGGDLLWVQSKFQGFLPVLLPLPFLQFFQLDSDRTSEIKVKHINDCNLILQRYRTAPQQETLFFPLVGTTKKKSQNLNNQLQKKN